MFRPDYQKGKQYTGDSSQGIRYPLVPLWGSKNEGVAPLWRFKNTILGFLFWLKVIQVLIPGKQHQHYFQPEHFMQNTYMCSSTVNDFQPEHTTLAIIQFVVSLSHLIIKVVLKAQLNDRLKYTHTPVSYKHQNYFQPEHLILNTYMCSSTYMAFSQNTSHPLGDHPYGFLLEHF